MIIYDKPKTFYKLRDKLNSYRGVRGFNRGKVKRPLKVDAAINRYLTFGRDIRLSNFCEIVEYYGFDFVLLSPMERRKNGERKETEENGL